MEKGASVTHIDSGKDQLREDEGMSANATLPLAGKAGGRVYTRRAVIRGEGLVLLRSRWDGGFEVRGSFGAGEGRLRGHLRGVRAGVRSCPGCWPADRSRRWHVFRFGRCLVRVRWTQAAAWNGSGPSREGRDSEAGVAHTAPRIRWMRPGSGAARAIARVEGSCFARALVKRGSRQV